jgi:hypothetical protein
MISESASCEEFSRRKILGTLKRMSSIGCRPNIRETLGLKHGVAVEIQDTTTMPDCPSVSEFKVT